VRKRSSGWARRYGRRVQHNELKRLEREMHVRNRLQRLPLVMRTTVDDEIGELLQEIEPAHAPERRPLQGGLAR
jgi:hypothetical protein